MTCDVYCGSHVFPWEDMAKAALCLEYEPAQPQEALRAVQTIRELRRKVSKAISRQLPELLSQVHNLLCTDSRDKIYGILGLATDIKEGELVPDYTRSYQEIYINAAIWCIRKYQSLAVLSCVRSPSKLSGLPSWVPDWNIKSTQGESLGFRYSENYAASGRATPNLKFSSDGRVLHVQGILVDVIHKVAAVMSEDTLEETLLEWEELTRDLSTYPTGETYPTIFWRTLIADGRTRGIESDQARQQLFESYMNLTERNRNTTGLMILQRKWEGIDEMSIVNTRASDFNVLFEAASFGRRLAITKQGFFGLVPVHTEVHNQICIFQGGQVPLVLMRSSDIQHHKLVGECYLQGWMDGLGFENSNHLVEEFIIH